MKLLSRDEFRESAFKRDSHKCVICPLPATAVHHVVDRALFLDGGYYIDNGVSLCDPCHVNAEKGILTCEQLRNAAGISSTILPSSLDPTKVWDKWGCGVLENCADYIVMKKSVLFEVKRYAKIIDIDDEHFFLEK